MRGVEAQRGDLQAILHSTDGLCALAELGAMVRVPPAVVLVVWATLALCDGVETLPALASGSAGIDDGAPRTPMRGLSGLWESLRTRLGVATASHAAVSLAERMAAFAIDPADDHSAAYSAFAAARGELGPADAGKAGRAVAALYAWTCGSLAQWQLAGLSEFSAAALEGAGSSTKTARSASSERASVEGVFGSTAELSAEGVRSLEQEFGEASKLTVD